MNDYEHHLRTRRPFTDTSDLDAAGQFKAYFRGPRIKVRRTDGHQIRAGWHDHGRAARVPAHSPRQRPWIIQQTERGRYRLVPARPQPAADDDGWWWQP